MVKFGLSVRTSCFPFLPFYQLSQFSFRLESCETSPEVFKTKKNYAAMFYGMIGTIYFFWSSENRLWRCHYFVVEVEPWSFGEMLIKAKPNSIICGWISWAIEMWLHCLFVIFPVSRLISILNNQSVYVTFLSEMQFPVSFFTIGVCNDCQSKHKMEVFI